MRQWVEGLLWEREAGGPDVFRIKGVLRVAASPRQHLLQARPVLECFCSMCLLVPTQLRRRAPSGTRSQVPPVTIVHGSLTDGFGRKTHLDR